MNPSPSQASSTDFNSLPLSPAILTTLTQLGYNTMTPIQAAGLPPALAGTDLIAQAETGSGKTAVFGLTLLTNLNPRRFAVQALVLCPTRELADQVAVNLRLLARGMENIKILTLCGGVGLRGQKDSLAHGAHIVVGTPGRIMDHLQREILKLDALNTFVLDEADKMLDMGFVDDMVRIADQCPKDRQTLLFSATFPEGIEKIARQFLKSPQRIRVEPQMTRSQIDQRFYEVTDETRFQVLGKLLNHFRPISTVVFCNTKIQCHDAVLALQAQGFSALEISGDLEQRDRDDVLARFSGRGCSVLVATDVASRGLDITQLEAVINLDITPDPEVHTHRIGRTGRAGETGLALSLAGPREKSFVRRIEEFQKEKVNWYPVEELTPASSEPLLPPMTILQILGGKKEKIRPADVLGALTADLGYTREQVGKIKVTDFCTYVSLERSVAKKACERLGKTQMKGKPVRVRII